MYLTKPISQYLIQMMSWISTESELLEWAGPNFRYPYNLEMFSEDLKLQKLQSYCLISDESDLLAFGQFYLRLGRCHLGRLIVNPEFRGQGIIHTLIDKLSDYGCAELNVNQCSLFVLNNNEFALRAYKAYGFKLDKYPKKLQLENCLYMIKSH